MSKLVTGHCTTIRLSQQPSCHMLHDHNSVGKCKRHGHFDCQGVALDAHCLPADRVAGPKDIRSFKRLLSVYHHDIYQQCGQAAKAFAMVVKTMAAKGEMYTCSVEKMKRIEDLWVACGYEDISMTVAEIMWQVKQFCCFVQQFAWNTCFVRHFFWEDDCFRPQ